jgi:cytochrome c-type biogenesis protein CcmH/NrfG
MEIAHKLIKRAIELDNNLINARHVFAFYYDTKGEYKKALNVGLNFRLYELLEDTSYLETAYNQVQEKIQNLEPDVAAKFLSYPIPKAIVEEWEKVK